MQPAVILQSVGGQKALATVRAVVRLLVGRRAGVDAVVVADAALRDEAFAADGADEWMKAGVAAEVGHETTLLFEQPATLATSVNNGPLLYVGRVTDVNVIYCCCITSVFTRP